MLKLAICDDEEFFVNRARECVIDIARKKEYKYEVLSYSNEKKLVEDLIERKIKIDILLIDIDMPAISGLEIAKIIREARLDIVLIFLTAHSEYVYTSFEYQPLRYVKKELMREELPLAIERAMVIVKSGADEGIIFEKDNQKLCVNLHEITYIDTEKKQTIIHTYDGGEYRIWIKFSDAYEQLKQKSDSFVEVYRNCVINLKHVITMHKGAVMIDGKEKIEVPISRRKQAEVENIILRYWRDHT